MVELTKAQMASLGRLPINVYSPGVRTFQEFAPMELRGLIKVRDIGSDEAQETILEISITDAGRSALSSLRQKP